MPAASSTGIRTRLLWASDCPDTLGEGCIGFKGLAAVRRLAPNPGAVRKIFHDNAARLPEALLKAGRRRSRPLLLSCHRQVRFPRAPVP